MADCSWGGTTTTTDTLGAPCNINWGNGTFVSNWDFHLYKTGSGPRIMAVQTAGTFSNSWSGLEIVADHQSFSLRSYGSGFTQYSHAGFNLADMAEFWSDGLIPGSGKGFLIGTGGPYATPAPLIFATNGVEHMRITGIGTIGIGTATPNSNYALDVAGAIHASNVIGASYQDFAEWVPASSNMTAGTVVVLNRDKTNEVVPSSTAYDPTVAGVVSAKPGIVLGDASPEKAQVATTGRVKVKVDATKEPIKIGDILVTSDKPGMAMKSIPVNVAGVSMHRPGTIVGKALEPLASGEGEILVLLSLQ
ncbi:MAG TPA: hypothetical protein VF381_15640 [Thermoanaerobaculia bacterium]